VVWEEGGGLFPIARRKMRPVSHLEEERKKRRKPTVSSNGEEGEERKRRKHTVNTCRDEKHLQVSSDQHLSLVASS